MTSTTADFPQVHELLPSLADATVLDLEGRSVRLGSLWRGRPAILVFVRHFG